MRRILRPRVILPIVAFLTLILVGVGYWWGYQVVDSIEIRNDSDETVYFVTGGSAAGCIGDVGPHSIDKLEVRRWSFSCKEQLRFHFGDERIFYCSWEAAKRKQPVIVTASGASCETYEVNSIIPALGPSPTSGRS